MEIVQYPHPTLRYKSKPVTRVDRELKVLVREMFELMYDAHGIGLENEWPIIKSAHKADLEGGYGGGYDGDERQDQEQECPHAEWHERSSSLTDRKSDRRGPPLGPQTTAKR